MFLKSWELDLELSAACGGCVENEALRSSCLKMDLWGNTAEKGTLLGWEQILTLRTAPTPLTILEMLVVSRGGGQQGKLVGVWAEVGVWGEKARLVQWAH